MTDFPIKVLTDTNLMAMLHELSLPRPWSAESFVQRLQGSGVVAITLSHAPKDGFILL